MPSSSCSRMWQWKTNGFSRVDGWRNETSSSALFSTQNRVLQSRLMHCDRLAAFRENLECRAVELERMRISVETTSQIS